MRCFDDAEIIHIEGDVDPIRDLDIISEELRIKDIEFVEKALENLKKQTRRGGQSLEMKKLKEEEATVERILELLKSGKDVRHEKWGPKEVCFRLKFFLSSIFPFLPSHNDEQELHKLDIIPALRTGFRKTCSEIMSNSEPLPIRILYN